jgi:hypothetical protein
MEDTATRRYNAFVVRPALHGARQEEIRRSLHVQSGDVALAVSADAAIGWIQRQTTAYRSGPDQISRNDNRQYCALSQSKKE